MSKEEIGHLYSHLMSKGFITTWDIWRILLLPYDQGPKWTQKKEKIFDEVGPKSRAMGLTKEFIWWGSNYIENKLSDDFPLS
ncbi:predicted protein [Sclerotinia sclerotiorum 1980 UF-70]|uniref:Uncharacterized protein n=1 Tax=Sclerotinia sclerotiorum (strain ATCC 18683 / 1980 / Ss-1) TaxID=665079 RepID=A7EBT5_SCLS1|nr:predicted protein [Sclerotinia sclerotiorum 1980 UF-70]EDN99913.1 predicted protein [Sclerotinia sclerotiorum 1980 UF-70]